MIQFYSLMWVIAMFSAIMGFLRGWNREVIVTAGVILSMFLLFQLDSIIRGTLLVSFSNDQVFLIQVILFGAVIYFAYRQGTLTTSNRQRDNLGSGILGAVIGALNGYLIGGTLWYFLDINEYPMSSIVSAPAPTASNADAILALPMVVFSGGVTGGGDFLVLLVIAIFLLVILVI